MKSNFFLQLQAVCRVFYTEFTDEFLVLRQVFCGIQFGVITPSLFDYSPKKNVWLQWRPISS